MVIRWSSLISWMLDGGMTTDPDQWAWIEDSEQRETADA